MISPGRRTIPEIGPDADANGKRCTTGRGAFLSFGKAAAVGLHPLHADAERALELQQLRPLFAAEERGSDSALARAACAAHAVDEVLRDFRQIVVDDVRDVLHVNAASRDVRGHQDAVASLLKAGESRGSLGLRAVAMNHGGGESFAS